MSPVTRLRWGQHSREMKKKTKKQKNKKTPKNKVLVDIIELVN